MNSEEKQNVIIIGPPSQQRDLIGYFISKEAGIDCSYVEDPTRLAKKNNNKDAKQVILWNWQAYELAGDSEVSTTNIISKWPVALYGVPKDIDLKTLIMFGVKGAFYEDESPAHFVKGVEVICDGELWFPRKAISECIKGTIVGANRREDTAVELSAREREILKMVATGHGNPEISKRLFISIHTVKTHVYNIFRKVGVNNRVQAALWWQVNQGNLNQKLPTEQLRD